VGYNNMSERKHARHNCNAIKVWMSYNLIEKGYNDNYKNVFFYMITEFVWQVKVQEKGLGASYNILGPYRVCLTAKSLTLIKMGCKDEGDEMRNTYEFSVSVIASDGSVTCLTMLRCVVGQHKTLRGQSVLLLHGSGQIQRYRSWRVVDGYG
jgi:hypothetical protein